MSSKSKPLVLALLALACVGLAAGVHFFKSSLQRPSTPAQVEQASAERPRAARSKANVSPVETDSPLASGSDSNTSSGRTNAATQEGSGRQRTASSVRVAGTVVMVNGRGGLLKKLEGVLLVKSDTGQAEEQLEIPFAEGKFRVKLGDSLGFYVVAARLKDGTSAVVENPDSFYPIGQGDLEITLRSTPGLLLEVRARHSRALVSDVEVVNAPNWARSEWAHPGEVSDDQRIVVNGNSPIEILPTLEQLRSRQNTVFVRAPGYAWTRVILDFSEGGQRLVELEEGGDLTVELQGDAPDTTLLRFRNVAQTDSQPAFEVPVQGRREIKLAGMLVGNWRVSAELGSRALRSTELGSAEAEIYSRGESRILLPIVAETVQGAVLSGVVITPETWRKRSPGRKPLIILRLLDPPLGDTPIEQGVPLKPIEGQPGELSFEIENVQIGRHELVVKDPAFTMGVEVGNAGLRGVRLEIPSMARVTVTVLDKLTGEPADVGSVFWFPKRPDGATNGPMQRIMKRNTADQIPGVFSFLAPQAAVTIGVAEKYFEGDHKEVQLREGENEVQLRVRTAALLFLTLRDGETPVPWEPKTHIPIKHLDGGGNAIRINRERGGRLVSLSEPGRYQISPTKVSGYRAITPFEVIVEGGKTLDHVVFLQRE